MDYEFEDDYNRDFWSQAKPHLQDVHLHVRFGNPWRKIEPGPHTCQSPQLALRNLTLCGVRAQCAPSLFGLTYLNIYRFAPTYHEFRDLFSSCPALSTLILREMEVVDDVGLEAGRPVIDGSSLQTLAMDVGGDSHRNYGCSCPLSLLHMPNLEYLEIFDPLGHTSASACLLSHFSVESGLHAFLKLTTLRLHNVSISYDCDFYRSLSSIEKLELIDCMGAVTDLTTTRDNQGDKEAANIMPFPHLFSITFTSSNSSLLSPAFHTKRMIWLRDTALSRLAAGCPEFTIRVKLPEDMVIGDEFQVHEDLVGRMEIAFFTEETAGYLGWEADPSIERDESEEYSDSSYEGYQPREPWNGDGHENYEQRYGGEDYEDEEDDGFSDM